MTDRPPKPGDRPTPPQDDDFDADFQAAFKALLDALGQMQQWTNEPVDFAQLAREPDRPVPDCEEEYTFATRMVEQFFTDDVAIGLLPPEARDLLGPVDRWSWCLRHIRCCLIFGWLLCRRPFTFRSFVYYLYRYWLCVRHAVGVSVQSPPTLEERDDFQKLVQVLVSSYRPYLADQLATLDLASGIPDEVFASRIDCHEGDEEAAAILERLLSADTAPLLLGRKAFDSHSQEKWFWFCRCWCLCAIRLGCCLVRAQTQADRARCLAFYRRCLRRCFQPLTCDLTSPADCVAEEVNAALSTLAVAVTGTAGGAGFSHYILEWSTNNVTYHASDFHYPPIPPGGSTQGNNPVFGGLLALLRTFHDPGLYFIRLTVYSVTGATCVVTRSFELFKQDVRILGVDSFFAMDTSWADPAARFVENVPALCTRPAGTFEASFGDCLTIQGGAFVGGCEDKKIKRYEIALKPGFETICNTPGWTNIWAVDYNTPAQYRFINWRTDSSVLTSVWAPDCIPNPSGTVCFIPPFRIVPDALLSPSCWNSHTGACDLSGLYTLKLTVQATDGSTFCDTQRIWIDNKPICAMIRIDAVPKCADLFVSKFALPPDCSVPWSLPVSGIATS